MRNAIILSSLMLVWACGPKNAQRSIPGPSDPADEEASHSEETPEATEENAPETSAEETPPAVAPAAVAPADAAPADAAPAEEETQPVAKAKKRYRRGGGKVRKGGRAIELKKAVNGAGKRVTLENQKAPVLVLTFGASWCAPCKKELPALETLAKKYSRDEVSFVAVNIDSTIATGKTFMKRSGLKRVLAVYDPKNINVQSYNPPTMPSVFIMNEGIVKHLHPGFRSGDERKLKRAIDRELK